MPSRAPPKAYQIILKTHRLTIFLTAPQSSTIARLKEEALSALTSSVLTSPCDAAHLPTAPGEDVDMDEEEVPRVASVDDFELCRVVKDKGKSSASAPASVSSEMLDPSSPIKGLLSNWETLYVQFKDEDGNLLPVQASQPALLDEDEGEPRRAPVQSESSGAVSKGKRKAPAG